MEDVIIKSSKYGIHLILDDKMDFEELIKSVCYKFAVSKEFFGPTHLVLSFEGRELDDDDVDILIQAIELNSDVRISLINEQNELKNVKLKEKIDKFHYENVVNNAKIVVGNVSGDKVLSSDTSLVILGDIKQDATVRAKGHIICMGAIYGEAYAGYSKDTKAYIVANEFIEAKIIVGALCDVITATHKKKMFKGESHDPFVAAVFDGEILVEPLVSSVIKSKNRF